MVVFHYSFKDPGGIMFRVLRCDCGYYVGKNLFELEEDNYNCKHCNHQYPKLYYRENEIKKRFKDHYIMDERETELYLKMTNGDK